MAEYFEKFMKQTGLKVDREVAKRWEFDAWRNGDKTIKTQMATARRTATTLERSVGQFSNLRPEQELAIKAATSAMRALANDLQGLATWAKAFKTFADAEHKKDRAAELEAIAVKRWGDDADAQAFECDLIRELTTNDGRAALGQWMHGRGESTQIAADCFFSPFTSRVSQAGGITRAEAAECIEDATRSRGRHASWDGRCLHCSWQDYEAYLVYRRAVAGTTARVMQLASQN